MAALANNQIAEALATMANLMARDNDLGRDGEKRLERFMTHKPTIFTGGCYQVGRGSGDYL
ncbi:hypothetical protein A2U01_0063417 [Trifolium medium]|uniref:Uncharacterized protein n=1 Tax=Trifolium medium TaxID=97028 RepID=A0A392RZX8_9FABA|nr:hypothetical protein [Trifolium medium]